MQDMVNLHAIKNVLGKLGPHFTLLNPTKEMRHQFQSVCGYYSPSDETFPSCWVAAKFSPVSNPGVTLIYRFYIPLKPSTYM